MGRELDLILATQKGNISAIKRLLGATKKGVFRNKVSPNFQDSRGYTPLHHAIMYGQKEALLMLLRYGADPRISDKSGNYPLHTTCQQGDYDSLQLLVEHSPIRPEIDQQNANDDTSLIIAAQEGMYALVEFLLRAGADPHITNKLDQNCLELASYYGRKDVVNLLLRKVPGILDTPHSTKHTCLHFAARNGHNSILQLLIDKGISINTTCNTGSCLHEAALHGRIETVAYVLDRNIDVYLTNSLGQTVLEAIQSLAASLCRSRIQQLISDHICHKLKLGVGNRKNTRSYHNGLSSHTAGFRMEGVDDSNAFQRNSSFIIQPSQAMLSNISNNQSESSSNNSSYSAPYQQLNPRDPLTSNTQQNQAVHYANDAIMYTRKLRGLADANIHYDDDVTHAPLSVIRNANSNLPVSLQGNGIYYYKTPSAKFNPPQDEIQSLPPDFIQQYSDRKRDSTSSDDYVIRQERNRHNQDYGLMGGALLQSPDVITSESEFDEASVDSSNHNSYSNLANLYTKRSAPLVKLNPAHSLFADLLSDEPSEGEQEICEDFRGSYDRTLGFPTDGSYIPLNDRSASVLGCNESIDRREFVKNCAKHPIPNFEDSARVIAIKGGDRVTYYPPIKPEPLNTNRQNEGFLPSTNNDRSNPPEIAVIPPVPVRRQSTLNPMDTPSDLIYQSNRREFKPLIPEPVINRPRKKSAPVIRLISPAGDNSCPYPAPLPDPILRKHSARGTRRFNTYHEGDYEPTNYPNEVGHFSDMNHSGTIPQPGRKTLEKPPPGKPRGNKGYLSGNLTSDTSRSTSPSFSDTQFRPKYFQESRYSPIRSPPYFQPEIPTSYKLPLRPVSTSGEDTPQEFLDHKSDPISTPEDSMSLRVEDVFPDSKMTQIQKVKLDRNRTLTREDSPPDMEDPEWESIDNVMDMVAQISSEIESTTSTEMTSSLSPISVPDLMQCIELPHRTPLLMSNGFDDIGFLAGILTQDELEDIGIEDIAEIQHILAAVNLLPAPEINTRPSSISQWLIQIGLHKLYHLFTSKGFNTIDDVCHLWDIQLSTVLQIHQLGYRRRILYSLSRIRAASPERNFTPSDSEFYSPPFSLASFSDNSFPMDSSPSSSIPPPPPRKDSYDVTQELWSYYDKHATHSYPRGYSRQVTNMNGTLPQERIKQQYSQPIVQKKSPPPLPPKNPIVQNESRKPIPFPKPVLANNIVMKKSTSSSSFTVKPLRPAPERVGPTGEMREVQTKRSYSQIGMQLKNTVDLMSDNTKETLISYIAESLQLQPHVINQHNSNDNRSNPTIHQLSPEQNSSRTSKYTRKDRHSESSEFAVSPIYQQRIEETGENLPPEAWLNRSDRRYHSIMCHSTPTQLRDNQLNYPDENIASFYPEGDKKSNSDNKKYRFGKFRTSKKVVKQNPVYESSSLLQGLPQKNRNNEASTASRVPKPHLSSSTSMPSSSYSLPPSIPIPPDSPASEIRIRSPMVMRRETMSTSLDNEELADQTQNLWVHPINKLTSGSICYTVKFMGTAVVSSLVGKETINITCKKIKEASKRGKKVPSITLSISWKWIKLYGIEKERLMQEHMMHHISYSSQYMEDLRMFAFISRDKKNPKYYCNVFQSPTIEHADEVVHTLGQAFEISYQHLLNAKNTQKPSIKVKPKVNKSTLQSRSIPIKFHRSQSVDDVI